VPFPPPSRGRSGPRRRTLLVGAFALAGCSAPESDTEKADRGPSAAGLARARAARDSASLVTRYDAVIAALPELAERLAPLRAEVALQVKAFGGKVPPVGGPGSSPAPTASSAPPVPADVPGALAELAARERLLTDRRTKALLKLPGESARLMASVAAAGAAHAYLLAQGQKQAQPQAEAEAQTDGKSGEEPSRAEATSRADTRSVLAALQAALAAEHAAVYGYGVVGGRIGAGRQSEARAAYDAHRARRDELERTVQDLGGRPVAAGAAYALPFAVSGPADAVRLAAELEDRIAGVYSDLVRAAEGDRRAAAAVALRDAAVRAVRWRGSGVAFPGLAERAAATPAAPTPHT